MLQTTGTYVAALGSAAARGVAALRAARQESPPQATGAAPTASTSDQNPPVPDADGTWARVDAAAGEAQRLSTRHTAFSALQEWEEARCADFKTVAAQHARVFDMLAKRAALGNQEALVDRVRAHELAGRSEVAHDPRLHEVALAHRAGPHVLHRGGKVLSRHGLQGRLVVVRRDHGDGWRRARDGSRRARRWRQKECVGCAHSEEQQDELHRGR